MSVFDEMGKYWTEIADQNQTDRQVHFIKNTLKPKGLVLDLACGTGRHLIPLGKQGYSMVGLDVSAKLLLIAKSRWRDSQVVCADMRFLPFRSGAFTAAVSMDTSFGYLPTGQDDLESLKQLRASMVNGAILIVDVFNREYLIKRSKANSQSKWRDYPSFFLLQKRTIDAHGEKLHDQWTVRDKADWQLRVFEHVARLYTWGCLQGLIEKAGFSVKAVYGDYEGQTFSVESHRLILVANIK